MLLFIGWIIFLIFMIFLTMFLDKNFYLGFWYYCFIGLLFGVVTAILSIL